MKPLLALLAALSAAALSAQVSSSDFSNKKTSPSGQACTVNVSKTIQFNGVVYTCQGGAYAANSTALPTQGGNTITGNSTGSPGAPTGLTPADTRTVLGLGTAALQPSTAFDASGAASAALASALSSSAQKGANLADLANAATARTNLGLGTAATQPSTAFDASGSASAAQAAAIAASDPSGSAASAQAAAVASSAQKTANGSDFTNPSLFRTNIGLGTISTLSATNTPLLGSPTIGGNKIAAVRVATLPVSCVAGADGAVVFASGSPLSDATYVCDGTGNYALPPGGSSTNCVGDTSGPCGGGNTVVNLSSPSIYATTNTVIAANCSGANAGAKILSCISALTSAGGIVDANGLTGSQAITTDFSTITKKVDITLGPGTTTFSAVANTIPANVTLHLAKGAIIDVASLSNPLRLNAQIVAAPGQQIFANPLTGGAGSVIIGGQNHPEFSMFGPAANLTTGTGTMTASSNLVTLVAAMTVSSGQQCIVGGAGTSGGNLKTTASASSTGTTLTLAANAVTTTTIAQRVTCGDPDTVPALNFIKAVNGIGGNVGPGEYLLDNSSASGITLNNNWTGALTFSPKSVFTCNTVQVSVGGSCVLLDGLHDFSISNLQVGFAGNPKLPTKIAGAAVALQVKNSRNGTISNTKITGGPSAGVFTSQNQNLTFPGTLDINHTTSNGILSYSDQNLMIDQLIVNDSGDAAGEYDNITGSGFNGTTVTGATYTSGITASGAAGTNCLVTFTNGGGTGAFGYVQLSATNTIATGTIISVTSPGSGFTSAPTAGTAGNGTAACSGSLLLAGSTKPYGLVINGARISNSFGGILLESKAGAKLTNIDIQNTCVFGISVGSDPGTGLVPPQAIVIDGFSIDNAGNYFDPSWDVVNGCDGTGGGGGLAFTTAGGNLTVSNGQITNGNGTALSGTSGDYVSLNNILLKNNRTGQMIINAVTDLHMDGVDFDSNTNIPVITGSSVTVAHSRSKNACTTGSCNGDAIQFTNNTSLNVNGLYVSDNQGTCTGCKIRESGTTNVPTFNDVQGVIADTTTAPNGVPVIISPTGVINASLGLCAGCNRYTVGTSGVTVNLLAGKDTSNPTKAILPISTGCGFGVALQTVAAGGLVVVQEAGIATLIADNSVTAGDFIIGGITTPGRGSDAGGSKSAIAFNKCIVGVARTSATVGNTFQISLTPADFGIQTAAISGAVTIAAGATTSTVTGAITPSSVVSPTFTGTGTATAVPQAGAGAGATAPCATSHVCDSFSGEFLLTSGAVPAIGSDLIIMLPITRTNLPNCSVEIKGGTLFLGDTKTVTTSTITISTGAALAAATAYTVNYVCGGN